MIINLINTSPVSIHSNNRPMNVNDLDIDIDPITAIQLSHPLG